MKSLEGITWIHNTHKTTLWNYYYIMLLYIVNAKVTVRTFPKSM